MSHVTEIQITAGSNQEVRPVKTPAGARRSMLAALRRHEDVDQVEWFAARDRVLAWDGRSPLRLTLGHQIENTRTAVTIAAV
jgi:hypothetical protein